jgi:hypothetical protein
MSLLDVYADSAGEAYDRQLANPGPMPEQGFNATSFAIDAVKGLPSAALEVGGTVSDALSAYGTAAATAPISAGGMFSLPTQEEQKQQEDARQRMLKGDAFNVAPGNVARAKSQEFGAKAVGAVGTMGPIGGGLMLGLEEGNTVTQNLRSEGVDTKTAAKVGAVQGTLAAGGAVLPIAGKTITQTLGLVGVGGPGSYMAQEYLSREILAQAGYNDQASLHNPFDPLGLTLSAVIPGGFGALHMRGTFKRAEAVKTGVMPLEQMKPEELRGLKYNDVRLDKFASVTAEKYGVPPAILLAIKNAGEKSNPTAVSKAGAQGVMQFMPGTAKEMGLVDRTDPIASIDAGARYMRKLYDAYGSWDAAIAHYNGGGAQAAIVRGGGRPTYNETAGYLDRVQKYVAEHTAQQVAKSPEVVDAARVAVLNETVAKSLPDTPDAMAQMQRAADIVAESGGRRAEAAIPEPMVTVYHGTLYQFDAFDSAHIGKGEGAQAFGHGLYLAENERVAEHYRDMLAREPDAPGSIKSAASRDAVSQWVSRAGGDREQAAQAFSEFAKGTGLDATDQQLYREILEGIQNPPGFTYKATIPKAMADRMIDLDAPIEQAPKVVQDYFRRQDAYKPGQPLTEHMAIDKFASAEFSKAGIPGIRYLDAPSRGAGNGSRNYVIFPGHEGEIRMGERNGVPIAAREADNALPDATSVKLAGDEPAPRGAEVGAVRNEAGQALPTDAEAAKPSEAGSIDALMAQKLAAEQPDLQVILPGTDTPISVKEAMARIAEEQKQDTQWGDLVRVAAECALMA